MISLSMTAQDLQSFKWKNRILIVQASEENPDKYHEQLKIFVGEEDELKDRKLIFCQVVGNRYTISYHKDAKANGTWHKLENLKYNVSDETDFRVTLIGLDGGEKLKQDTLLEKAELYRIIDSMPMRRNETKYKGH